MSYYPTHSRSALRQPNRPCPPVAPPPAADAPASRFSLRTLLVVLFSIAATGVSIYRIHQVMDREKPVTSPYQQFAQNHPQFYNLITAIRTHDDEKARELLIKDPWLMNVSYPEVIGTPLHYAASSNQPDLVDFLVQRGADVRAPGRFGGTPLHWAAWRGSVEAMRALIAAGAEVDARQTEDGSTPLFWVARGSREGWGYRGDPVAASQVLLDAGARADTANKDGITAAAIAGDAVRELLVKHGATPPTPTAESPPLAPLYYPRRW